MCFPETSQVHEMCAGWTRYEKPAANEHWVLQATRWHKLSINRITSRMMQMTLPQRLHWILSVVGHLTTFFVLRWWNMKSPALIEHQHGWSQKSWEHFPGSMIELYDFLSLRMSSIIINEWTFSLIFVASIHLGYPFITVNCQPLERDFPTAPGNNST